MSDSHNTYKERARIIADHLRPARPKGAVALIGVLAGAFCVAAEVTAEPPRPIPPPPQPAKIIKSGYTVKTIAKGLDHPWSMAFLPDGSLLVTERVGRLRLIKNGELQPEPVAG